LPADQSDLARRDFRDLVESDQIAENFDGRLALTHIVLLLDFSGEPLAGVDSFFIDHKPRRRSPRLARRPF
jgi:hypothetical protein